MVSIGVDASQGILYTIKNNHDQSIGQYSIYTLEGPGQIEFENQQLCFKSNLHYCPDGCIHDTFLDGDTLYVLRNDGTVLRIDACGDLFTPASALASNASLDVPTLSVPNSDFFMFDGQPCLSTPTELLCAGSERVPIEVQAGYQVAYVSATRSVMIVSQTGSGLEWIQTGTASLDTGESQSLVFAAPTQNPTAALIDRDSGQWGLLDLVTGEFYEYNSQLEDLMLVSNATAELP